jgi:hypothetical protein
MSRKRTIATLAAVAVVIVLAAGAAIAPDGSASTSRSSGNKLAGTWIVTVERAAPLPPFTVHQVFTRDGSFISFGGDPPASRSSEMGSWERIEGRLYANSGSFFRYNVQTGAHIGSVKISRTLRLSEDGQSFTMIGRVQVLDLAGNVVTSFLAQGTGERMQVERIAEQP